MRPSAMRAQPGFATRARESFARQTARATRAARFGRVAAGEVDVLTDHGADLTQQHGFLHAGVVASALDSACGCAALTLMPAGAAVPTIEFRINLLAPALRPRFRFESHVAKAGRTISVVEGRALQFDVDGGDEVPVATMTATMMTVVGRDELRE